MKQHQIYFDYLRGLAILMVIGIHTFQPVSSSVIHNCVQIVFRQLISCSVPIFLAISGYFLGRKMLETRAKKYDFWKKQIPKVYVPALLWSIPLFVLTLLKGGNVLVATFNLFFMGYSIYYFIALIIQCYVLLPYLQKINLYRWGGGNFLYINIMRSCYCLV